MHSSAQKNVIVWKVLVAQGLPCLPCESRNLRSGTSFSKSTCRSTPRSKMFGDMGAEVQEVELKASSRNGEPDCWGEKDPSWESVGPTRNNRNQTQDFWRKKPSFLIGFFCLTGLWTVHTQRQNSLLMIFNFEGVLQKSSDSKFFFFFLMMLFLFHMLTSLLLWGELSATCFGLNFLVCFL